ncbi:MAG: hypothetical protein AB1651_02395 [Pseudomonadota bacterium]
MRALRAAFVLHLVCFALLLAAQPPWPAMLALGAGFGGSWLWTRRHPALGFGPRAPIRLVWHGEGGWTLHRADGAALDAELADDSIVTGSWLILRFRLAAGGTAARLLFGDELAPEMLRRLRARLSVA